MPTATAPPRLPKMPRKSATVTGSRRDRNRWDDSFERRLAEFEVDAAERMRDMRHRAKQARRVVMKNAHQWKSKKVRTTLGMAGRVAGVGLAGGYLATRTAVVTGRRAYRRSAPHVRRAAGHTARYVHTRATVYGQHYATSARRRALRTVARHRVAGRKRQRLIRDPLLHAALVANGQMSTRNLKVARRAAALLDPRSKRTTNRPRRRRTMARLREQDRQALNRAAAIRRDPDLRVIPHAEGGEWAFGVIDAYPENSAPRHVLSGAGTARTHQQRHQKGTTVASSTVTSSTNPAAVLESGFKLVGDFEPIGWVDWIQQMRGQAAAFRQASQSYLQLAVYMDLRRRMDPRALIGLYVIAAAMGQAADVFIATANQFWLLYSDRFETNGRGRTMDDEQAFFGQQ